MSCASRVVLYRDRVILSFLIRGELVISIFLQWRSRLFM